MAAGASTISSSATPIPLPPILSEPTPPPPQNSTDDDRTSSSPPASQETPLLLIPSPSLLLLLLLLRHHRLLFFFVFSVYYKWVHWLVSRNDRHQAYTHQEPHRRLHIRHC
ncbi:putative PXMP2/4 family protein 4 [Iris pallida]|uniref:PXMP2/4 family protein 4 n=1 Tax=Iris pallida TaxID=29817 RepID=A0AAX6G2U3_IRIPA|nr:putative PXMP2/4 family protein 4 [Iris pallida]